ncbi:MAG: polysaccharide pyruvyl transferase family protein [Marinilabiliaceae bacterium]|nr:polysaccharide pyruvyl transferase family protein [Marinilabiliaceae bacterium]
MTIAHLHNIIVSYLQEEVTEDYVLLDCPFHANLGDHLIWEGTLNALNEIKHNCLYTSSIEHFEEERVKDGQLILICGGGNFGDVWPRHQEFRRKLISLYPHSRVIHLPQTIRYEDIKNLELDRGLFNSEGERHCIMTRDQRSFLFAKEHFPKCRILLVPDMAFALKPTVYIDAHQPTNDYVYIKRKDHELSNEPLQTDLPKECETRDWPTYERLPLMRHIIYVCGGIIKRTMPLHFYFRYMNWAYSKMLHPYYVKLAVKFIARYKTIYTTRLHAGVLAHLMNRQVNIIDNNYGKMAAVWDTWITNVKS